jgi:hypothetical protein
VNCLRTDRRPDVLLKRPDGASWHRSFSIRCRCPDGRNSRQMDVRMDGTVDRWTSGRDDTSSGRLTGNIEILLTSLRTVESLFAASIHISDFVQTQNEAKILIKTSGSSGISFLLFLWFCFSKRFLHFIRKLLLKPIIFHQSSEIFS